MDSSAETIKLKINYQKKDYEIELPLTATVYQLKEAVYKATNVPVALQKLLRSGLQLKDDNASLQAAKITNNAKIMLVATDLQVRSNFYTLWQRRPQGSECLPF